MGFDPEAIEIARLTVESELPARRRALNREIGQIRSEFIRHGQTDSSGLFESIADACAREIESGAARLWEIIHRCVLDTGVEPDDDLANDLIREARNLLDHYCVTDAEGMFNYEVQRSKLPPDFKEGAGFRVRVIGARQKLHAEIRLFARSLMNQARARGAGVGAQVFNVYAPVGAIQTGPSAQAFVTQELDASERNELLEALERIATDLASAATVTAADADEISEAVEDTRAELEKQRPNRMLLWAKLSAVASMIRAVPVLESGYQVIRGIALVHGIALP
jgi:hypothetical protein